jgi:hypothetical protein
MRCSLVVAFTMATSIVGLRCRSTLNNVATLRRCGTGIEVWHWQGIRLGDGSNHVRASSNSLPVPKRETATQSTRACAKVARRARVR